MSLLFRASEHTKLGFGAEATLFSFRRGNFLAENPGVPVQAKDMVFVNVYLLMRRYFQPTLRTSPYVGAELGFLRISGAEYKEIVNGVRVTYYEIPGALRLTASAVLGVDQYLSRRLAIQVDVRATYIHNDPSVGLILGGRGGLKLTL
jgi:outer membrane protein W